MNLDAERARAGQAAPDRQPRAVPRALALRRRRGQPLPLRRDRAGRRRPGPRRSASATPASNAEWVAPDERPLSWVCGLAITSSAENVDAAYRLINWQASARGAGDPGRGRLRGHQPAGDRAGRRQVPAHRRPGLDRERDRRDRAAQLRRVGPGLPGVPSRMRRRGHEMTLDCRRGRATARGGAATGCGGGGGAIRRRPAARGHGRARRRGPCGVRLRRHGARRDARPVPGGEPGRRPQGRDLRLQQGRGGEARRRLRGRRGRGLHRRDGAAARPQPDPAARPGGDPGLRQARVLRRRRGPQRGGPGPVRAGLGRARMA